MKLLKISILCASMLVTSSAASNLYAVEYVAYCLNVAKTRILSTPQGEDYRVTYPEVFNLSGITEIRGLVYDHNTADIILVGERNSEKAALTLDDYVVALRARFIHGKWPLVSIDPVPETEKTQMQVVRFEGGIENTRYGQALYDADYTLKQIAIGSLDIGIPRLRNYWDLRMERIRENPAKNHKINTRFWFYPIFPSVLVRGNTVAIKGHKVRVFTEVLAAEVDGKKIEDLSKFDDSVGEAFVEEISNNFDALCSIHPSFSKIEGLNQLVALTLALEKMDEKPDLSFWLRDYQVNHVRTERKVKLLKRAEEYQLSRKDVVYQGNQELCGGVQLMAIALRLKAGDVTALEEAVLNTRPRHDSLSWSFAVTEWLIPTSPEMLKAEDILLLLPHADFLVQNQRYDDAIAFYDKIIQLKPDCMEALKGKAVVLKRLGRDKEALIYFERALRENPLDGHTMLGMAMVLTDLDQHAEALRYTNKAIELSPNFFAWEVRAVILAQTRNYEQALASLEKPITECDPCDITSMTSCLIRKGIVLGCLERYKESIETCLKARALGVTDAEEQMMMEICGFASETKLIQRPDYLGFGGYITVPAQLYDRLMGRYWRRDPEILTFAGLRYMMSGAGSLPIEHEAALSMFNFSIELNPDYAEAYSLKGVVLDWQGKHKEAKIYHTKAIKLHPQNAVFLERLANNIYKYGDSKKALSTYEKATRIYPKSPTAWANMGVVLVELDKYKKALQCFDEALALFPRFTNALGGKASTLILLGRHSEALKCLEKGLELKHDDINLWKTKVEVLARMGRRAEALKMCDDALRKNPKSAILWQTKANALIQLKDYLAASACARMAEELSRR